MQPGKSYDRLSNETMRRWVADDMASVRGTVGVDFGAGKLLNRPLFHVQRYIAVDFNEDCR